MMRLNLLFILPLLVLLGACNRDPKVVCKKYVDNGNKYFDRGKYNEASIMYRNALKKDPRYSDAYYHLGLVDLKLGLYGEAQRSLIRAVETDTEKKNNDAVVKLADLYLARYMLNPQANKGLIAEIKDLTKRLTDKDPNSYDGFRLTGYMDLLTSTPGDAAQAEKNRKQAIVDFYKANQVKPYQPELVFILAQNLFMDGRTEEAERLSKELLERQKTYDPVYNLLYGYYIRTNQAGPAEELLKKKVAYNPGQGVYLVQLAAHYRFTKREAEMTSVLARLTGDPKTFPNGQLLVGDFYFQMRELDKALQAYEQGEKSAPAKEKGVYEKRMVEVLSVQGKNDQAAKLVTSLMKADSKDPETLAMHASLLLRGNDQAQAQTVINELQPLIAKESNQRRSAVLHYYLARAYRLKGDQASLEQARLQYQESLSIQSGSSQAMIQTAKLELAQLELARGDNQKAVQQVDEVLVRDPGNLGARLIRTSGLMNMGELDKARSELILMTKAFPNSNDVRYQLAYLDLKQEHYKEAEAGFEALRQMNDPRGLSGIIQSKTAQKQFPEAIRFLQDQLKKQPDRDDVRMALAQVEMQVGKFPEAIRDFQMLLDKNPKALGIYVRLGEAKRMSGDIKGAEDTLEKVRQQLPNDPVPVLELAMLYDVTGRNEMARKEYEKVLKMDPNNEVALNNLAYSQADDGVDLDNALAYAKRAQQRRPADPNVKDTLGLIYIKKNLTDDGLRLLTELVQTEPKIATYRLHLAMALYQKGDKTQAKKELESAMQLKPTDKEQTRIKELKAKIG